jgi:hypothetical protein
MSPSTRASIFCSLRTWLLRHIRNVFGKTIFDSEALACPSISVHSLPVKCTIWLVFLYAGLDDIGLEGWNQFKVLYITGLSMIK